MKIGVFTGGSIPSYYAHSFNVMKMASGFSDLGHDVEVVTSRSYRTDKASRSIENIYEHYGVSSGIKITYLKPSAWGYFSGRTSGDKPFCEAAIRYAGEGKFDLVFCRNYLIPVGTAKKNIPTVIETHTTRYDHPDLCRIYDQAQNPYLKALVTIHDSIAKAHTSRGIPEDKIMVLDDGVDLKQFEKRLSKSEARRHLKLDADKQYAVYCGHLYADKGIELIMDAAGELLDTSDLQFLLVGGNAADVRYWKKKAGEKGLDNICFTGFVSNASVPTYLQAADCLLLPYKLDMEYKVMDINTTSPLKLFEYMAASRPIVATNVPVLSRLLVDKKNAWLAEVESGAFGRTIRQCLSAGNTVNERIASAACDLAKTKSWQLRCEAIITHALEEQAE